MIRIAAFADEASKDVKEQIAALKRNGLEWIEVRGLDGQNVRKITEDQAREYARQFSEAGIRVWAIGSPVGKMKLKTNGDFEEQKSRLKHMCRLAQIFGTDRIRVFSFYEAYDEKEKVISYLKEMVQIASEYQCRLFHENEKQIYGDVPERVLEILDAVPGLYSVYDPANFVEVGVPSKESLDALHARADYFHVKDALWESRQIVPAGHGAGDVAEMIRRIGSEDRTLTVEPHLAVFDGYAEFDPTEMKNKYTYASNNEAFDTAVSALKTILLEEGYIEVKGGFEKK